MILSRRRQKRGNFNRLGDHHGHRQVNLDGSQVRSWIFTIIVIIVVVATSSRNSIESNQLSSTTRGFVVVSANDPLRYSSKTQSNDSLNVPDEASKLMTTKTISSSLRPPNHLTTKDSQQQKQQQRQRQRREQEDFDSVISPRIAGGNDAQRGRYPYYVALRDKNDSFRCGGSLIAPNIVLSAAHCQDRLEYAVVGVYSEKTVGQRGDNSERINIVSRHPNPLWIFEEYSYDQMILVLERDSIHPPVKLNFNKDFPPPDANVTLIGMGRSAGGPSRPDILQETKSLSYIENEACQNLTDDEGIQPFDERLSDDMICVFEEDSSQCNGDSGGPFLVTPSDNYEDDVQIALVSWSFGIRCGNLPVKWPGVGSRTSTDEWIRAVTCQHVTPGTAPFNFFCDFVNSTFSPSPTRAPSPPTLSPAPSMPTVTLVLILYFDEFPHEVTWLIRSVTEGTLIKQVPPNTYPRGMTMVQEEMQVPPGDYRLVLEDTAGDGIDSDQTLDGISYEIIVVDETSDTKFLLVKDDGDYQTRRVETFTVPLPEDYPSASPSIAPSLSGQPTVASLTVFLRFDFDDWHKEISWAIVSPPSDDGESIVWASVEPGTYIVGGIITERIELPLNTDGNFILIVRDSFGDGFGDGDDGENGYILFLEDPLSGKDIVLAEGDGNIGSETSTPFSIFNWTSVPTEAPLETVDDTIEMMEFNSNNNP